MRRAGLWIVVAALVAGGVFVWTPWSSGDRTELREFTKAAPATRAPSSPVAATTSEIHRAESLPPPETMPGARPYDPTPIEGFTETLVGRVLGPSGEGVPDVTLTFRLTEPRDHRVPVGKRAPGKKRGGLVRTDGAGRFEVPDVNLMGGIAEVWFRRVPRDYVLPVKKRFPLSGGAVELVLEHSEFIEGIVVPDPERGMPTYCVVNAHWHDAVGRSHASAKADASGRFSIGSIPPGATATLVAYVSYARKEEISVRLDDGTVHVFGERPVRSGPPVATVRGVEAGNRSVEIRLGEQQRVKLVALTRAGTPLVRARIEIEPHDASVPNRVAITDAQGRAEIEGLPDGSYSAMPLTSSRWGPLDFEVENGKVELVFSVMTKKSLVGHVIGSGDVGGFRVAAKPSDGGAALIALTDDDGRFELELDDGVPHDLNVERFGDERCAHRTGVVASDDALTIRLERGGSIRGQLLDVDGKPVDREGWAHAFNEDVFVAASILSKGRFTLYGLPPGRYTVRAGGGGSSFHAERKEVLSGTEDLVLRIPERR